MRLRELAWELEKTGTDLCVAPALLDVAGPRTTIRPVAGLPLLHVDHPEFTGAKQVIKDAFDKVVGALRAAAADAGIRGRRPWSSGWRTAARRSSGRPGWARTAAPSPCTSSARWCWTPRSRKAQLAVSNEQDGVLFKIRNDPRITASAPAAPLVAGRAAAADQRGARRHVAGRPAAGAAGRGGQVRRLRPAAAGRQAGLTGLWQVNGRSDLSWEESVRLDLRYVENWSLVLDLQILWKTTVRGNGAGPARTEPGDSGNTDTDGAPPDDVR